MATMKPTLLEMTQTILSAMNSDEVNSISDTTESLQVAEAIKHTYFNMLGKYDLPEHDTLFQLQASGDNTQPCLMFVPDGCTRIEWIKYYNSNTTGGTTSSTDFIHDLNLDLDQNASGDADATPGYAYVNILPLAEFDHLVGMLNPDEDFVDTMDVAISDERSGSNTFTFRFRNDKQPQFCTIFNNYYILFDSYDNTQDTTLQASKTKAWGWLYPEFTLSDSFVPNLDAQQFPLLLNDAKALVFFEQKQMPHAKAEEEVYRQRTSMQKWKSVKGRIAPEQDMFFNELPNFGR